MINSNINFDTECEILKNNLETQKLIKKTVLKYIDEIASNSISTFNSLAGEIAYDHLIKVRTALQTVEENINNISALYEKVKIILDTTNLEEKNKLMNSYIESCGNTKKTLSHNVLKTQTILNNLLDYITFNFSSPSTSDIFKEKLDKNINEQIDNTQKTSNVIIEQEKAVAKIEKEETSNNAQKEEIEHLKENVLLISDMNQKVVLPYKIIDLENIFKQENEHYKNLQEVVDKKYTIPLSYYKNTAVSRFKEAYSLVRTKEHGSVKEALDLGLEVFFNYDLNPAIITACQNIDELDVYLACLENNEVNKFNCFDIVYEGLPVLKKQR